MLVTLSLSLTPQFGLGVFFLEFGFLVCVFAAWLYPFAGQVFEKAGPGGKYPTNRTQEFTNTISPRKTGCGNKRAEEEAALA